MYGSVLWVGLVDKTKEGGAARAGKRFGRNMMRKRSKSPPNESCVFMLMMKILG